MSDALGEVIRIANASNHNESQLIERMVHLKHDRYTARNSQFGSYISIVSQLSPLRIQIDPILQHG